jgi:hypothetical protein
LLAAVPQTAEHDNVHNMDYLQAVHDDGDAVGKLFGVQTLIFGF